MMRALCLSMALLPVVGAPWAGGAHARGRLAEGGVFERADAFGCASREDYARVTSSARADRDASDRLRDRLVRSGACAVFVRGEPFTIEARDGDLLCLRPQSERDCLWAGRDGVGR